MTQTLQAVSIDQLHESPFNTRRHTNAAAFKEFAANIAKQGVLTPLLVRPNKGGYEIGAGHRRYKAAKQAGFKDVLCIVRDMPDAEFIELIQIENLQREDVHPLDEANGYQLLIDKTGQSVAAIAVKVSKDPSYIYKRLKLAELVRPAQDAFIAAKINTAHAIAISRLQPKEQQAALKECLAPWRHGDYSVRDLNDWIARMVHLDLTKASFDTKDAKLVPSAGSCTTCPKRAGTQPELFDDIQKGDTCTHPGCYHAKIQAHSKRLLDSAKAQGKKLIKISTSYDNPPNGVLAKNNYQIVSSKCANTATAIIAKAGHGDQIGATRQICADKKCKLHWTQAQAGRGRPTNRARSKSASQQMSLDPAQQRRDAAELAEVKSVAAVLKACRKQPALTVLELKYLIENLRDAMCGLGDQAFDEALLPHFGFAKLDQFDRAVAKTKDKKRLTEFLLALALTISSEYRSTNIQFEDLAKQRGVDVVKLRAKILADIKHKDKTLAAAAKKDAAAKTKAKKPAKAKSGHVSKTAKPKRGVCRICGCTDTTPCDLGIDSCAWKDNSLTLCTNPKCLRAAKAAVKKPKRAKAKPHK